MIGLLSDHSITRVGRREAVHKARSCETRAGWSPNFAVPAGQGKPASARRRVQLQGAARWPGARRTSCTLSARLRAATKQMGPYRHASPALLMNVRNLDGLRVIELDCLMCRRSGSCHDPLEPPHLVVEALVTVEHGPEAVALAGLVEGPAREPLAQSVVAREREDRLGDTVRRAGRHQEATGSERQDVGDLVYLSGDDGASR